MQVSRSFEGHILISMSDGNTFIIMIANKMKYMYMLLFVHSSTM